MCIFNFIDSYKNTYWKCCFAIQHPFCRRTNQEDPYPVLLPDTGLARLENLVEVFLRHLVVGEESLCRLGHCFRGVSGILDDLVYITQTAVANCQTADRYGVHLVQVLGRDVGDLT